MLPANIGQAGDNALSIAASSNKGTLIRYLNDQVEDGFYTLVIDSLKDSNFDLSTMTVDDEVRAQCTKLYELAEFVDFNIKATGHYAIEEWIEPLFRFVYGDIDPTDITCISYWCVQIQCVAALFVAAREDPGVYEAHRRQDRTTSHQHFISDT